MKKRWELFFITILWVLCLGHNAQAQDCTPKVDYDDTASCSGKTFVARSTSELNQYLMDFALTDGKYKNVRMTFRPNQTTAFTIHSPCSIEIDPNIRINASSICLDARERITIGGNFTAISTGSIKAISQRGDIMLSGRATISAQDTSFSALRQVRIRKQANVSIQGSFSAFSSGAIQDGKIYVADGASLSAEGLSLASAREVLIGHDVFLSSTGTLSLLSTGSDAFGFVQVQKRAQVEAVNILISSQNRSRVGPATLTGPSIEINGIGCSVSQRSILNSNNLSGSCLGENINRYPHGVSISATPLAGVPPLVIDFSAHANESDGTIESYKWDFGDGNSGTSATTSHTFQSSGEYLVTMVVKDDQGARVPKQVLIQVGGNLPPTANAGANAGAALRTTVTLDGTATSDPESGQLSYAWQLSSTPTGSTAILANPKTGMPFFIPDIAGDYTFSLVVSDGQNFSAADTVTITAFDPPNRAPTLSSIGNKTVALGSELKIYCLRHG